MSRQYKTLISVSFFLIYCFSATTFANTYGLLSVGYSDVDLGNISDKSASYGVAFGYQFAPQWYVEAGYLNLIDHQDETQQLEANGPYISVLGKATGNDGELYYRLGVASIDKTEKYLIQEMACIDTSSSLCEIDERILAGMIGLGFDYFIGRSAMLRLEYTYMGGEDDFSTHSVNVGFRYNF